MSEKRVKRLMREEQIQGKVPKRFKQTTNSNHHDPIAANVLDRDFTAAAPNQRWAGDTTEFVLGDIVDTSKRDRAAIDADPNLTQQGKAAARAEKRAAAIKAVTDLQTPRLGGLDADVAQHRAALIPASAEKPDPRRIDFLLSHLKDRTALEIAMFYNSATDDEKLVLEEAARSVGRIPTKRTDGSLAWMPLLPAETINESIIARATAKNPQGATKLQELEEIRAMHVSMATLATAEIKDAFGG